METVDFRAVPGPPRCVDLLHRTFWYQSRYFQPRRGPIRTLYAHCVLRLLAGLGLLSPVAVALVAAGARTDLLLLMDQPTRLLAVIVVAALTGISLTALLASLYI